MAGIQALADPLRRQFASVLSKQSLASGCQPTAANIQPGIFTGQCMAEPGHESALTWPLAA